jgi:predicted nucleic acid-binding protein
VVIAALRSQLGASHKLLMLVDGGKFETNVSVPLVLEYEDAAKRLLGDTALTAQDVDNIVDYICAASIHRTVFYLWRPFLNDPKDDMVLELAVAASCDYLVTYNSRDFAAVEQQFGIKVVTAREFLHKIGEIR